MLALLVATAHRRAGDARRAEHGRAEHRAARVAADGRRRARRRNGLLCAIAAPAGSRSRCRCVIDDQGDLEVADGPDLRGGFDPELALSILFRSQRRPLGRPHRHRLRGMGAPERRCRELRGSHLEQLHRPGRAGRAARARLRRQQRNVERRDRAATGIARPTRTRRRSRSRATRRRRAGHRLRAALRHAHRRAQRQRRAESARAGRAERGGDRDDRRARPGDHQPLVPLARREGIAAARGTAVQRRPRGAAHGRRGLQLLGRRRAGRAHPHRQGVQAERAEADGALDPGQRPDPRDPGPVRHPRRGAAALVGDRSRSSPSSSTAPAAGSAGGPTSPAATRTAAGCCRRPGSASSSTSRRSAAAVSSSTAGTARTRTTGTPACSACGSAR